MELGMDFELVTKCVAKKPLVSEILLLEGLP
jgi:hypothetical protein